MELSICIIGCGGQAFQSHLPSLARCLREDGGLRFAGCSDLDEERARRFRAELGQGRSYGDWRRMLREELPDCVLLVTPFTVTAAIAESCCASAFPPCWKSPWARMRCRPGPSYRRPATPARSTRWPSTAATCP